MSGEDELADILSLIPEGAHKVRDQKSIVRDVEKKGFGPDVVKEAQSYYKTSLGGITRRLNQRKEMIYDAVYRAHHYLNQVISPFDLAEKIGIAKSKISHARSRNFSKRVVRTCEVSISTVEDYIQYCTQKMEITEYTDLITRYKRSLRLSAEFNDKSPHTIALFIIYMFVDQNPIKDFNKKIILKNGITQNTIKKLRPLVIKPETTGIDEEGELDKYL